MYPVPAKADGMKQASTSLVQDGQSIMYTVHGKIVAVRKNGIRDRLPVKRVGSNCRKMSDEGLLAC